MPEPRKSLSATGISTFLRCQEQWRQRYVEKADKDERLAPAALAGSGFHAALEYAITRLLTGQEVTVEEAVAAGTGYAAREVAVHGLQMDQQTMLLAKPEEELDRVLYRIKQAATWYLTTQFSRLRPAVAEHKFEVPIPGSEWTLNGRIDLIEQDGSLVDFKLSGSTRPVDSDKADRSLQLSVYALARKLETGTIPPTLTLDYTRDGGKRISNVTRTSTRSEKDCQRTLTLIHRVIQCIESDTFAPSDPEGIWCNGKMCPYWQECKFGIGQ